MHTDPTSYLLTAPPADYGETDLDACKRIFRGEVFPCKDCGASIYWPGVCDECSTRRELAASPPSVNDQLFKRGVPKALLSASWKTFDQAAIPTRLRSSLQTVKVWRPSSGPATIVLAGPPGVGKTHLAVATLRRYVESGRRHCRFVAVPELLSGLRATYAASADDDTIQALERIDLLVLDDLGASRGTEWAVDVQSSLISARYNAGLGTVITTNLNLNQIADRIDERIASRLAESLFVWMDLADRRVRKAS